VYGRNIVVEALQRPEVTCEHIHLARGAQGHAIREIRALAKAQGVAVREASREQVSRISRNARQDQGVAADLRLPGYGVAEDWIAEAPDRFRLLALDGVTTPRNVGMCIRSAVASGLDGVVIPQTGCAGLGPLVIKASAGTLFRAQLLRCETLAPVLESMRTLGSQVAVLSTDGAADLFEYAPGPRVVYVVGGEASGVSAAVRDLATVTLSVPMAAGVESLNVGMCATLVGYRDRLGRAQAARGGAPGG